MAQGRLRWSNPPRLEQAIGPGGDRPAIVTVLLFTGLRIAELVALDTGDLSISARKGQLTVRRGKGERYRQVPVNSEARTVLDTWLAARRRLPGPTGPRCSCR